MEFQLGSLYFKAFRDGQLVVVFPTGQLMVAIRVEAFDVAGHKSIGANAELYQKDDLLVAGKVQRWLRGDA